MLINCIFLIQVQPEKAFVVGASEILVRADLGEVAGNEVLFRELNIILGWRSGRLLQGRRSARTPLVRS